MFLMEQIAHVNDSKVGVYRIPGRGLSTPDPAYLHECTLRSQTLNISFPDVYLLRYVFDDFFLSLQFLLYIVN